MEKTGIERTNRLSSFVNCGTRSPSRLTRSAYPPHGAPVRHVPGARKSQLYYSEKAILYFPRPTISSISRLPATSREILVKIGVTRSQANGHCHTQSPIMIRAIIICNPRYSLWRRIFRLGQVDIPNGVPVYSVGYLCQRLNINESLAWRP